MWGQSAGGQDAGLLTLRSDRQLYHPGEEALVSLPSMEQGNLLVTVEKAGSVLSARWHSPAARQTELRIPITKEMLPNAYLTVSYLQPYAQSANDRPIRMYGIQSVNVVDPGTVLHPVLRMPDVLEPE